MSVGDVKAESCPFCGKSTALEHIHYDNCFVVRCLYCGYISAHTASERGAIENHNKICRLLPKPDPNWKVICAKCMDGEIEPADCEYYGEPNGCNSPIYGEYPTAEKSSAVGNAAAMREALLEMKELDFNKEEDCYTFYQLIDKALAAPPRNCDVGTAEEQSERFDAFCDAHKHVGDNGANWCLTTCPCYNDIDCEVKWAQMPYEEGGAK